MNDVVVFGEAARAAARSVPLTRDTMALVQKAIDAQYHLSMSSFNSNHHHREVTSVDLIFMAKLHRTEWQWNLIGVIDGRMNAAWRYMCMEREANPEMRFRILSLFEDRLGSFTEYAEKGEA